MKLKKQSFAIKRMTYIPKPLIKKLEENGYRYVYELQKDLLLTDKVANAFTEDELDIIFDELNWLGYPHTFEDLFIIYLQDEKAMEEGWKEKYELYCCGHTATELAQKYGVTVNEMLKTLKAVEIKFSKYETYQGLVLKKETYRWLSTRNLNTYENILEAFRTGDIWHKDGIRGLDTVREIAIAIDAKEGSNLVDEVESKYDYSGFEGLDLSSRVMNALKSHNIHNMDDIKEAFLNKRIYEIQNIGNASIIDLAKKIDQNKGTDFLKTIDVKKYL